MQTYSQDDLDRARAEGHTAGQAEGRTAGHAAGLQEGRTAGLAEGNAEGLAAGRIEGAKAERERVKGIMSHAEATGREASAQHLALNTDTSVEAAAGILGGIAKSSSIGARQQHAQPGGHTAEALGNASGALSPDEVAAAINKGR